MHCHSLFSRLLINSSSQILIQHSSYLGASLFENFACSVSALALTVKFTMKDRVSIIFYTKDNNLSETYLLFVLTYQDLLVVHNHPLKEIFRARYLLNKQPFLMGRLSVLRLQLFLVKSQLTTLIKANSHELFIDLIFYHLLLFPTSA